MGAEGRCAAWQLISGPRSFGGELISQHGPAGRRLPAPVRARPPSGRYTGPRPTTNSPAFARERRGRSRPAATPALPAPGPTRSWPPAGRRSIPQGTGRTPEPPDSPRRSAGIDGGNGRRRSPARRRTSRERRRHPGQFGFHARPGVSCCLGWILARRCAGSVIGARRGNPWAEHLYQQAIARKHDHPHASASWPAPGCSSSGTAGKTASPTTPPNTEPSKT